MNPTLTLVPCDAPRAPSSRMEHVLIRSSTGILIAFAHIDTFWTGAGENKVWDHLEAGRTIEVELSVRPGSARD